MAISILHLGEDVCAVVSLVLSDMPFWPSSDGSHSNQQNVHKLDKSCFKSQRYLHIHF